MHSAAALSAPLSALAALHAARGGAWLNAAARLTLHVVYATPEDIIGVECYEELLHLLPNLRELRVLISGPESQFYVEGVQFRPAGTCGNCSGAGKRRFLALARGEYEEVMNEPEVKRGGAPDLVMALNAAVYQQHVEGAVTVALALSGGAPLLLTSYAADSASAEREFVEVVAKTARLPLRVAQPTALNPWASPCLKQDTCAGADELVEGAGVLRSGLAEARELTLERFYTSNSYVHTVVLAEGGRCRCGRRRGRGPLKLMFCPREVGPLVVGGLMGGGHAVSPLRARGSPQKNQGLSILSLTCTALNPPHPHSHRRCRRPPPHHLTPPTI